MTIEDGSSLSQSETHLEVFQNLVESDCDMPVSYTHLDVYKRQGQQTAHSLTMFRYKGQFLDLVLCLPPGRNACLLYTSRCV